MNPYPKGCNGYSNPLPHAKHDSLTSVAIITKRLTPPHVCHIIPTTTIISQIIAFFLQAWVIVTALQTVITFQTTYYNSVYFPGFFFDLLILNLS